MVEKEMFSLLKSPRVLTFCIALAALWDLSLNAPMSIPPFLLQKAPQSSFQHFENAKHRSPRHSPLIKVEALCRRGPREAGLQEGKHWLSVEPFDKSVK